MGLHSLLGLGPPTINGESLPQYLNRTTRPAPKPKPNPLDVELTKWRHEQAQQAQYDRAAMLEAVRRNRAAADVPRNDVSVGRDAERRWRAVKRWNEIAKQLGDDNGE